MLNGLDLFSGIGGLSLALDKWVHPVAYCESDRYAQSVLLSRMFSGELRRSPIWDDVRTLQVCGRYIDIIYGGFPCQDISLAGNGIGLAGERSGLFFEIIRLAKETHATFVFLENVPAIRTRGLRDVIRAFTDIGYDCRWTCVSAAEVGAPHLRKRWFLLAYSEGTRTRMENNCTQIKNNRFTENRRAGLRQKNGHSSNVGTYASCSSARTESEWSAEPDVGRVVNGLPNRVDRIKGLGNAVVPLQARTAFERLMGIEGAT